VTGEQMLDEGGQAVLFQTIEIGVFKEIEVAGAADSFDFAEDAEGVEAEFIEFFAGGGWKHGRNYINFRMVGNGTLVLRAWGLDDFLFERAKIEE
jgi:hypothetical protein